MPNLADGSLPEAPTPPQDRPIEAPRSYLEHLFATFTTFTTFTTFIAAFAILALGVILGNSSTPAAKFLIISSDENISIGFQAKMTSVLDGQPVDALCARTGNGLLYDSFIFNCGSRQETHVPRRRMRSWLLAYKNVYLVESGDPNRLNRSPFHDNAVYEHVRSQVGSLRDLAEHDVHVTVVLTDVTCEGMSKYMRTSGDPIHEGDCLASSAGRAESFERFYARVGVNQGGLGRDYVRVDAEGAEASTPRLPLASQVRRALLASPHTSPLVRDEVRDEWFASNFRGEPLGEANFAEELTKLQGVLKEPPEMHFEPQHQRLVREKFPRYQAGFVGLSGAGKSTTLRWFSYYAGVAKAWRETFGVAASGGESFTRQLAERGMAAAHVDAPFAVFDTMGLERDSMEKVIEHDLAWLVDGRVRTTCAMKWLGRGSSWWDWWDGGCYQPWREEPEPQRALQALVFVTRFYPVNSVDFMKVKDFVAALRRMLHAKQKDLVVALTHLDGCDASLSTQGCMRMYEENLGTGQGNVVALGAIRHVPEYAKKAWPGLDGSITDEENAAGAVYLQPDAIGQLAITLRTACLKSIEQQLKLDDEIRATPSKIGESHGYFCIFLCLTFCWSRWRPTRDPRDVYFAAAALVLAFAAAALVLATYVCFVENCWWLRALLMVFCVVGQAPSSWAPERRLAWRMVCLGLIWQSVPFPAQIKMVINMAASVVFGVLNTYAFRGCALRGLRQILPDPDSLRCPITYCIMNDPVMTADGHTYEREAILRWLGGNNTSPRTGLPLESRTLRPNIALRNVIEEMPHWKRLLA